jgi:hypothetical protein
MTEMPNKTMTLFENQQIKLFENQQYLTISHSFSNFEEILKHFNQI